MNESYRNLTLCIPGELLEKFLYITDREDRTMAEVLDELVQRQIAAFEAEHGEIMVDKH